MKLKVQNPHIPLGVMLKMRKEDLLAAIQSKDVSEAGMELDKHALIIFLNYELNRDVKMPIAVNFMREKP